MQLREAGARTPPSTVKIRKRDQLTLPRVLTESPIVTLVRLVHLEKAYCESRRSQGRHGAAEGGRRKGTAVVGGDARARSAHADDGRHRVRDRHAREALAIAEGVLRVAAVARERWHS